MSTVRIKHFNSKGFLPLGTCSQPNCEQAGSEIGADGKVHCSRHLTVTTITPHRAQALRPGQGFGR